MVGAGNFEIPTLWLKARYSASELHALELLHITSDPLPVFFYSHDHLLEKMVPDDGYDPTSRDYQSRALPLS